MLEQNNIYLGDCLKLMKDISDKSIDMILCDLPYGNKKTQCNWDKELPNDALFEQYLRIIKDDGNIVLTAQEPFTSKLILSNIKYFRHKRVWIKDKCANFLLAEYQPKKMHEDIIVFSKGAFNHNAKVRATYNPIMEPRDVTHDVTNNRDRSKHLSDIRQGTKLESKINYNGDYVYPSDVIYIPTEHFNRLHPTQKPVKLFEYLIKTYSNENNLVLDNCVGSGTTAIACKNTNRQYIGIEKDELIYSIAYNRINGYIYE